MVVLINLRKSVLPIPVQLVTITKSVVLGIVTFSRYQFTVSLP